LDSNLTLANVDDIIFNTKKSRTGCTHLPGVLQESQYI
jgi:hypothetical protein